MKERLMGLICEKIQTDGCIAHCNHPYCYKCELVADNLLANGVVVADTNKVIAKNIPLITHIAGYPINDVIDLMEAKNAGRIVELPCAVGDTVYIVTEVSRAVIECIVLGAWVCEDNCTIITHDGTIHSASFGKTVFLTKEEALKALERSEGK